MKKKEDKNSESSNYEYRTIEREITNHLYKEKGSRFYSLIFRVHQEYETKDKLQYAKELYPNATHYCYAYRLGYKGEFYRVNDDGEPSGTAGLPIYNQLLSADIINVLLIVVRYFGGTKLGTSGLIKAYKESAKGVIDEINIITEKIRISYQLEFSYSYLTKIMSHLKRIGTTIKKEDYKEDCKVIVELDKDMEKNFKKQLSSLISQNFLLIKDLKDK